MNDNNYAPAYGIDWDTAYHADTLEVAPDLTPTATIIEGKPDINLSDTTWKTSGLFIPDEDIEDTDIVAYARACHWSVFAITSAEFTDVGGDTDPDDEPAGWVIVGK